jgi:hypothetical protein
MKKLGKLEKVQIQDVWPNEAGDFTPWLAQENNIDILGEELKLSLEVQSSEEPVGPFRADILCRDTDTDNFVLIENQYGRTDHKHLGQLMTYASGLEAATIIWISEKFTEEHRAALDWLNSKTDDTLEFFGVEIELYKIGDSDPAPRFNIIAKPNNWSRNIKRTAQSDGLSGAKQIQLEYWTAFQSFCEQQNTSFNVREPVPHHRITIVTGHSSFTLRAFANTRDKRIGAFIVFKGLNGFNEFKRLRELYEQETKKVINSNLLWEEAEQEEKYHRIIVRLQANDPTNREQWDKQHKLLVDLIQNYIDFFKDKVSVYK